MYLSPLSWTWVMERADKNGVAACFATEKELRAAIAELTGFAPQPHYTPEMINSAQAAMGAAGALALGASAGRAQLAVAGHGVMDIAGNIMNALSRAWGELSSAATVSAVGARLNAASLLFWSAEVGRGSDRVPLALSLPLSEIQGIAAGLSLNAETAQLPIRATLTANNDGVSLELQSTGSSGLSPEVPVLWPVRDPTTGLDRITLPATADAPEFSILINPTAPSNTGNQQPVPVTPVHTGTEVKPVQSPVIITTPVADSAGWRDFIYWRPDARGTGVEPVYVVVSDPLDSGIFTRRQLDKKYKHATDFGISDTRKNRETLTKFRDKIEAHLNDPDTYEKGSYILVDGSKVFFNEKSLRIVVLDKEGMFVSGWALDPNKPSKQYENYINTGILR